MKDKLRYLHSVLGIPYSFMAEKCGISQTHINLWLNGKRNLSVEAEQRVKCYYNNLLSEVKQL